MNHLHNHTKLKNRYVGLRHGRSESNERGVVVSDPSNGLSGFGLTDVGREQVRNSITKALKEGVLDSSVIIVASDFMRTRETAEIAKELLGVQSEVILSPRLRERHFGDYELKASVIYPEVWVLDESDSSHKTDNVESVDEVVARLSSHILELEEKYEGQNILLVSHGDPLFMLYAAFQKVPPSSLRDSIDWQTADFREFNLPQ